MRILLSLPLTAVLTACSPNDTETGSSQDLPAEPTTAVDAPAAVSSGLALPFTIASGQGVFLSITDIHFNPFTVPSIVPQLDSEPVSAWPGIFSGAGARDFVDYGSDSGYPLMISALETASGIGPGYDYVIYSGDYLAHHFPTLYSSHAGSDPQGFDQFVIKTVSYLGEEFEAQLGDIPILGVLGNNDAICGNYEIAPDSALFAGIETQWQQLAGNPGRFGGFATGGYYKVPHPTVPDMDVIGLNNIYWSRSYKNPCGNDGTGQHFDPAPGHAAMRWLTNEIADSAGRSRTVQILAHIPPGIDAFTTAGNSGGQCSGQVSMFYEDPFEAGFQSLVNANPGVIERMFAGHTHMDSFSILDDASGQAQIAINTTISVSPIFDNNPGFTVYLYDRSDGAILDSATYYLTNLDDAVSGQAPVWQLEYAYAATYGISDLSATSLDQLAGAIASDPATQQTFVNYYGGSTDQSLRIDGNARAFTCQQSAIARADYTACYCPSSAE